MEINKFLTNLTILIFILFVVWIGIVPSSIKSLCEVSNCRLCGIVVHHVEKIRNLFAANLINHFQLEILFVLAVYILGIFSKDKVKNYFQEKYLKLKLYFQYKLFASFHSLQFNVLKRVYADGEIEPQIYKLA